MRAMQITELTGPDAALRLVDLPDPEPTHMFTPGRGVVVDVHAAGVSFPELLQTRGEYQIKPPLPFVPGSEVGGIVRSAPAGAAGLVAPNPVPHKMITSPGAAGTVWIGGGGHAENKTTSRAKRTRTICTARVLQSPRLQ